MLIIIICNINPNENQVHNERTTNPSPNHRCRESSGKTSMDKLQHAIHHAISCFSWHFCSAINVINRGSIRTSLLLDSVLLSAPKLKKISRARD